MCMHGISIRSPHSHTHTHTQHEHNEILFAMWRYASSGIFIIGIRCIPSTRGCTIPTYSSPTQTKIKCSVTLSTVCPHSKHTESNPRAHTEYQKVFQTQWEWNRMSRYAKNRRKNMKNISTRNYYYPFSLVFSVNAFAFVCECLPPTRCSLHDRVQRSAACRKLERMLFLINLNKRNDMIRFFFFGWFSFCRHHHRASHGILDVCRCWKWIKKQTNKTNVSSRWARSCTRCATASLRYIRFCHFRYFSQPTGNLATIKLSRLLCTSKTNQMKETKIHINVYEKYNLLYEPIFFLHFLPSSSNTFCELYDYFYSFLCVFFVILWSVFVGCARSETTECWCICGRRKKHIL